MSDPAALFVKAPRSWEDDRSASIPAEIGRLLERHGIEIEGMKWVALIDVIDIRFQSGTDLAAFKIVCPFDTVSFAEGMALFVEAARKDQQRRIDEIEAVKARVRTETEMVEKLAALEAENAALRQAAEGGR